MTARSNLKQMPCYKDAGDTSAPIEMIRQRISLTGEVAMQMAQATRFIGRFTVTASGIILAI